MAESSADLIKRYLADAISAEKNCETQLHRFAKEQSHEAAAKLLEQQAIETKRQYEKLTERLHSLGGSAQITKVFLEHMLGFGPKTSGYERGESAIQNLAAVYTAANTEIAMYESLATMAEAAGDAETADLVRGIQSEKQSAARKTWELLPLVAREAYQRGMVQPG
jgi:ferritin-like metal-binding protein YciE